MIKILTAFHLQHFFKKGSVFSRHVHMHSPDLKVPGRNHCCSDVLLSLGDPNPLQVSFSLSEVSFPLISQGWSQCNQKTGKKFLSRIPSLYTGILLTLFLQCQGLIYNIRAEPDSKVFVKVLQQNNFFQYFMRGGSV